MKRRITALVLILLLSAALSPAATLLIEKGIFVGLGLSGLRGSGLSNVWNDKLGMLGGLALTLSFNDYFAIQPEIYLVQKGAVNAVSGSGGTLRSTMDIGVLEIPILAKLSLPIGESAIRPYIIGGVSAGVKLWANLSTILDDGSGYETQISDATVTGMYSGSLSYVAGIGTDFRAPDSRINAEIRYIRTMGSITKEGSAVHSGVLSLVIGYYF
jgi:hypothetical protein